MFDPRHIFCRQQSARQSFSWRNTPPFAFLVRSLEPPILDGKLEDPEKMRSFSIILSSAVACTSALIWEDGTGRLPAMGWNSWNTYLCDINATLFLDQAQAMLDHRLQVNYSFNHGIE